MNRFKKEITALEKKIEFNFKHNINESLKEKNLRELKISIIGYSEYITAEINKFNLESVKKVKDKV